MKEFILPSGKTAKMQNGKGYHLLCAQRKAKTTDEVPYALVAELAEIDGQKLVYEDILEMPIGDVSKLLNEVNKLGESTTPSPSSSSVKQQDGPTAK